MFVVHSLRVRPWLYGGLGCAPIAILLCAVFVPSAVFAADDSTVMTPPGDAVSSGEAIAPSTPLPVVSSSEAAVLVTADPVAEQAAPPEVVPAPPDPYSGWWTGPLLAAPGRVIPFGHFVFEPYFVYTRDFGTYDSDGKFQSKNGAAVWSSLRIMPVFTIGILNRVDLQVIGQADYQMHAGNASTTWGDTQVRLGFQIIDAVNGTWIPDVLVAVREIFPTGPYDRLDPQLLTVDVNGSGAYRTMINLNFQKVLLMPNHQLFRLRVNFAYAMSLPVKVDGPSKYETGKGGYGTAYPGFNVNAVIGGELHLTKHWVAALDLSYSHGAPDTFVGVQNADQQTVTGAIASITGLSRDTLYAAPAIEYNFNGNVGLIAGAQVSVIGRNFGATVSPMLAVNIVR